MKEIITSKATNTAESWVIMDGYKFEERRAMLNWLALNMDEWWERRLSNAPFRFKITFFDEKDRTMFLLKWV